MAPERAEGRVLRRGLPRVKGGEAWPPATEVSEGALTADARAVEADAVPSDAVPADAVVAAAVAATVSTPVADTPDVGQNRASDPTSGASAPDSSTPVAGASAGATLRRGLPRVAGGDPWPPAGAAPAGAASAVAASVASESPSSSARDLAESTASVREEAVPSTTGRPVAERSDAAQHASARQTTAATDGAALRRGLPRVAGGEPWPPAGAARTAVVEQPLQEQDAAAAASSGAADQIVHAAAAAAAPSAGSATQAVDVSTPLPFTRTVWQGQAPRHATTPEPEPSKLRPAWPQAIGGLLGLAALGLLAVAAVFFMRMFLSTPFMQDFLAAFPGEYHPTVEVEPGFAPWIGWQHFFNMFLMVLIIRSGLGVRSEKRPTVFWTARGNSKSKISLTLWFHQALDLLWIINGVIFVVLIIVTGHWVRVVPTSWEVFPNALSAGLQYVSLDWPAENGWVNYNALQQLAYFTTIFIAAPLAVVTGFRMSGLWPKKAEKLSKAYPVEWARALHFPTMLYFVAFIIAHVALVFLTGALRNLNHMFAAQGSVDGTAYASVWTGFWVFVVAMVVIAAGWFAARPLVLAPIARLFGQVSGR